jgi:hypothetical protein
MGLEDDTKVTRDSDQSAGTFEAEKAGGGLAGILAEENVFDRRALWRVGTWGVAGVAAVVVAVMANQASMGSRRDRLAAGDLSRQAQQLQAIARESQNETRRLAAAIDTLNSDRDRLFSRVTVLEQGLDSATGTIARQATAGAAGAPTPLPALPKVSSAAVAPPNPGNSADLQPVFATQSPHPAIALVMGLAPAPAPPPPAVSDRPRADLTKPEPRPAKAEVKSEPKAETKSEGKPEAKLDAKPEQAIALAPSPSPAASNENTPTAVGTAASAGSHPLTMAAGSLSMIGPPDPAAAKLVEPPKATNPASHAGISPAPVTEAMASASPKESTRNSDASEAARLPAQRTEFAVDLGTANSVNGLRALWRGLLKSNAELSELRPIIIVREGNTGLGMQLRLAAGPLLDAASAAKICAALIESQRPCETTVFDGQRLAMSADDVAPRLAKGAAPSIVPTTVPAPGVKPYPYRRNAPKHAVANTVPPIKREEPPPPPKPESSSSISGLFGNKH